MNRISMSCAACLLAIASVWALSPGFAKEPAKEGSKPNLKTQPAHAGHAGSAEALLPECLAPLKLSKAQQEQIEEIVREYNTDIDSVWGQFGSRYRATIALESSLLAAIEDNLTETQRTHVRLQRRQVAQHEKTIAGTNTKPNQGTSKPADAVQEEIGLNGVTLTAEQESVADKVQEKYLNHLRSLNRDIQGLHTRLVSLEADKLVEIEKVLTKGQLMQLREIRQASPAGPKEPVSISESE